MSDLSRSELQGLGASLVATPFAVVATAAAVHWKIPGDTGITIACVLCALVFLAVPRIVAAFVAPPARAGVRRLSHG